MGHLFMAGGMVSQSGADMRSLLHIDQVPGSTPADTGTVLQRCCAPRGVSLVSLDARRRPLTAKFRAALCPRTSRPTGRNVPIMTHPVSDHTTVPAAELQNLHEQMMRLTARVGLALDRAGIDIARATSDCPPRPLPVDGNLFDLAAYRLHRHGGAA